ncbi:MAG: AMMECR1 domain-containing protein [Firmicutes bacterium]|nr:AMMECR1 domain-containing protein [Bacillota bacterium]
MPVVFGMAVPHEPKILPEVNPNAHLEYAKTLQAYDEAAQKLIEKNIDTIVIISPHSKNYNGYFYFPTGNWATGSLAPFGARNVAVRALCDRDTAKDLYLYCAESKIHVGFHKTMTSKMLDYGSVVPLTFVAKRQRAFAIIRISISGQSMEDHYRLGKCISDVFSGFDNRRAAIIASGDMSPRLSKDSLMGYAPQGAEFDKRMCNYMKKGDFESVITTKEDFCIESGADIYKPLAVLGGALDGKVFDSELLSYEKVNGSGFAIATYTVDEEKTVDPYAIDRSNESEYVQIARGTLETFITKKLKRKMSAPRNIPERFRIRSGVFVTLRWRGKYIGCMGTIEPKTSSIYKEIMDAVVFAAREDKSGNPVKLFELKDLDYTVDVISPLEEIFDLSDQDVTKHGLVIANGNIKAVVLPGATGIKTPADQVDDVLRKLNADSMKRTFKMYRFTIDRYK